MLEKHLNIQAAAVDKRRAAVSFAGVCGDTLTPATAKARIMLLKSAWEWGKGRYHQIIRRIESTKLITNIMTQSREPDDIDRVNRELRGVNRQLDRLEYTQISPQEFSSVLERASAPQGGRIYEEIGASRAEMRAEFVAVNARLDRLETELTGKIDTILKHVTGQGNSRSDRN